MSDQQRETVWRIFGSTAAAVLLATAFVSADIIVMDQCSEEYLRRLCGEWWEWCWWVGGCYLM